MNKENEKNKKRVDRVFRLLSVLLLIILIVSLIYFLYYFLQIKSVEKVEHNQLYESLKENCREKYQPVNISYDAILQEYIDKIYSYMDKKDYLYLHLNVEQLYLEKNHLTVDEMVAKLQEIEKGGRQLNSYIKSEVDDKTAFVCKIGVDNSLLTIYEYKPGVYSFAFDGFTK